MRLHRFLRPVLALCGGLALWMAFPSHDEWWLAPIGVGLLAFATCGVRARHGFGLGFLTGLAMFLPTLSWSGVYVGALPWCALAVLESLYLGGLGLVLALLQRRRMAPFAGACAWVVQEWLRGTTPFGGFPWARVAFSQADAPWAPLIAWVSAPGLTFVVALTGGTLAAGALWFLRARWRFTAPRWVVVAAATTSVACLVAGSLITPSVGGRPLRVAAVQGNVPQAGLDFNAQRRAVLDNHANATEDYAAQVTRGAQPHPDLVVWPENSSDIDPTRNLDAGSEIQGAVDTVNAPTIVGTVLSQPLPEVSNTSLLYLPNRGITAEYVKQHPVPFGEYIPYRSFFRMFSSKVDLVRADFRHGPRTGMFTIPTHRGPVKVAPVICFEVAYDDLLRKPANDGAQMFIVQTNNATFGYTDESTQQIAISRLRALEYGRSVVHVSTVGVSALITPDGREHDTSSLFTRKVLSGDLPLRSHTTPAQRMGRAPEILSALALVATLAWIRRIRRAERKSSGPGAR